MEMARRSKSDRRRVVCGRCGVAVAFTDYADGGSLWLEAGAMYDDGNGYWRRPDGIERRAAERKPPHGRRHGTRYPVWGPRGQHAPWEQAVKGDWVERGASHPPDGIVDGMPVSWEAEVRHPVPSLPAIVQCPRVGGCGALNQVNADQLAVDPDPTRHHVRLDRRQSVRVSVSDPRPGWVLRSGQHALRKLYFDSVSGPFPPCPCCRPLRMTRR